MQVEEGYLWAEVRFIVDQDFPYFLWGEASLIVVCVSNISPHRIMEGMTPNEAFSRKKPKVRHMRIFGCPIYVHVPKEKRNDLKPS